MMLMNIRIRNDKKAAYLMAVQSVALAGGHLLVAAHALGLGGVWMCAPLFASSIVKNRLKRRFSSSSEEK
jgi:nitroreductase